MMQLDVPYRIDAYGQTAQADGDKHVRDLIEEVLFTSPGERVNRPTFGSGLLRLLFAPNSDALATATQLTVQGALQQWLGDLIQVDGVDVSSQDSSLRVTVRYIVRQTQEQVVATFTRTL